MFIGILMNEIQQLDLVGSMKPLKMKISISHGPLPSEHCHSLVGCEIKLNSIILANQERPSVRGVENTQCQCTNRSNENRDKVHLGACVPYASHVTSKQQNLLL